MALLERLEEIYLIRCSLLPDEIFSFLLDEQATREWLDILEKKESLDLDEEYLSTKDLSRCQFEVNVISAQISFLVSFPSSYPGESLPEISVKGDYLSRSDQQRWQSLIEENLDEFIGTEYPVYQLLSSSLLPLVHDEMINKSEKVNSDVKECERTKASASLYSNDEHWHALLTSHHLISPTKRRNMQHWADELSLTGFAKLGHPGVIYSVGTGRSVEEFVKRVKSMQWLALRVRFVECLEPAESSYEDTKQLSKWVEFEKIGEVVEQMRNIGRESYVLEMGIGSAGKTK